MTAAERPRGTLRLVGGAAAAKVVVMGLSGLLGIITSHLIIANFGVDAYAQYGLLTSIPTLLPFADLGIAAVIINVVAGSAAVRTDVAVRRTIVTAFRILIISGTIIAGAGVVISLLGAWPFILGNGLLPDSGPVAALVCLVIFGAVLPLTIGQRVLVGLNRTTTQIASQSVVAPFMLLAVFTCIAVAAPVGSFLAVFSYIGNALVSVICLVATARLLSPQLRLAFSEIPQLRKAPGVAVISTTWPVLVQMLALPVAMQTDRLLLSHLTTGPELAQYNLSSQLFGIILQTISAAGIALWPIYARARAAARVESPSIPSLWFLTGGLALGTLLAVLSPWLADFISDGKITLDGWLIWGFVIFVGLQAAKYPAGMYMTDKRGLTFQVAPILAMIPLNLVLSWWLIGLIGAGGTIIASAAAVLICQVIPNLLYVRRDLQRRRLAAEIQPELEPVSE